MSKCQKKEKLAALEAQISKLTETMIGLAAWMNEENNDPNKDQNETAHKEQRQLFPPKPRNMGGYCHSHGFHPVGLGHTSRNCFRKKECHKDDATWNNRLKGSTNWPKKREVVPEQQDHAHYKDKTKPTN